MTYLPIAFIQRSYFERKKKIHSTCYWKWKEFLRNSNHRSMGYWWNSLQLTNFDLLMASRETNVHQTHYVLLTNEEINPFAVSKYFQATLKYCMKKIGKTFKFIFLSHVMIIISVSIIISLSKSGTGKYRYWLFPSIFFSNRPIWVEISTHFGAYPRSLSPVYTCKMRKHVKFLVSVHEYSLYQINIEFIVNHIKTRDKS